jgi:type IV pilus assembly protein PilW
MMTHAILPITRSGRPDRTRPGEAGFGLVELMISMLIGLVIIAALVTLFVNTSGNNRELARANSMIENGRFAIKVLEEDLAHAGYWSGFVPMFDDQTSTAVPTDPPTVVPDPCLAYSPANWNDTYKQNLIGIPVQAYDDAAVPALATCVLDNVIDDYQAGTDVLVVRHTETCVPGEGGYCEADTAGKLYMQPTRCTTELDTLPIPYVFDTSGYTLTGLDCATVTEKRKFVSNIYYVRDHAVTAGDGIPTLVRSQFDLVSGTLEHQPAVALVEGIEAFRIEFGVDDVSKTGAAVNYAAAVAWQDPMDKTNPTNRGDGVPDGTYIRCTTLAPCSVADLMNVTSARIYVLARSREASPSYTDTKTYTLGTAGAVGPFNDNFKRHVFSATVRMPNIAGRRMSP